MLRNFPRTGSVTSKDFFKEVIGKDPRELADKHKFLLKKKKTSVWKESHKKPRHRY